MEFQRVQKMQFSIKLRCQFARIFRGRGRIVAEVGWQQNFPKSDRHVVSPVRVRRFDTTPFILRVQRCTGVIVIVVAIPSISLSANMHLGHNLAHFSGGESPHGRRVDIPHRPQMQEYRSSRLVVRGFKDQHAVMRVADGDGRHAAEGLEALDHGLVEQRQPSWLGDQIEHISIYYR